MASGMNLAQTNAITMTLSATRLATFDAAQGFSSSADTLEKYRWHALTSAAFFASLHICEVAIRNAIDNVYAVFPNIPAFYSAAQARQAIYLELESLRQFRNRIAHHEPILTAPLSDRQASIETLLAWRSNETLIWHRTWEIISKNIAAKP